ncbi:MAG: dihydropteroate synthase [Candidatus Micrarchaeota archaeon]|nr:dihydropteroate synthase [Candidatus Micrarchaeota archaeon]
MVTRIMGTIELGGASHADAVILGQGMAKAGAGMIELMAGSAHPDSVVSVVSQLSKLEPEVKLLVRTASSEVGAKALRAGASILEDTAVFCDEKLISEVRKRKASVLITRRPGTAGRELEFFSGRLAAAKKAKIRPANLILDVGVSKQNSPSSILPLASKLKTSGARVLITVPYGGDGAELITVAVSAAKGTDFIRARDVGLASKTAKIVGLLTPKQKS